MRLLIKGGRVIDPANKLDEYLDILIEDGKIKQLGKDLSLPYLNLELSSGPAIEEFHQLELKVIKAHRKIVAPGFIDMHTHLREPGFEYKETIRTGLKAAVAGGFTSIACMANTDPVNDHRSVTDYILARAQEANTAHLFPIGAITQGLKGVQLAEIGELKAAGIVALSDDGQPVMNSEVMRRAMEYARMFQLPIISHCQDLNLTQDGVMHEGLVSTYLGFKGMPAAAEEVMVARDIALAELTGAQIHIAHVSCAGSVRLIREAKDRGVKITAEVAPHHFSLTHDAVFSFDTNTKVNPPLRTKEDQEALKSGLLDGTIDVIASDHAPHELAVKDLEYDQAAFGISGLETAVALSVDQLYHGNVLDLPQLIEKFTLGPAKVLHLNKGSLEIGQEADITIIDPDRSWQVDVNKFCSKGRNSPFQGWTLHGMAVATIVRGQIQMQLMNE
jgi:dihydroorotase